MMVHRTGQELFEAIGSIDEGFVAEAADWIPQVVRFSKRKIALLVAALLLLTACAAYVAVEWDTLFVEKFNPSQAALEQSKDGVQQVAAVSVCDGYTFTVRQTLGDDRNLHIALDITFPESVPLAELMTTDAAGQERLGLSLNNLEFYHGKTEYAEIKGMDRGALRKHFSGRHISNGSSVGITQGPVDLGRNTASFLISYTPDSDIMGNSDDPYITVVIGEIWAITREPGQGDLLAQGPFAVSWPRSNEGAIYQMEVTQGDEQLGKVTLTAFSLQVDWFGSKDSDAATALMERVSVRMKDGTDFAGMWGSGGSISDGKDRVTVKYTWQFREILLLDQVDSIQIGDYTVKVP